MRTLRKLDIESMAKTLPIMLNEEQSSTVGGIFTTSLTNPNQLIKDNACSMYTLAYLSNGAYSPDDMKNIYIDYYARENYTTYKGTGTENDKPLEYYQQKAKDQLAEGGTGVHGAWVDILYNTYISTGNIEYDSNFKYDSTIEDSISDQFSSGCDGMYAALTVKETVLADGTKVSGNWNHAVVMTGYDCDSATFSYYDPQQNTSGTFGWEDLDYCIAPSSGNTY